MNPRDGQFVSETVDAVNALIVRHQMPMGRALGVLGALMLAGARSAGVPRAALLEAFAAQADAFYALGDDGVPAATVAFNSSGGDA